MTQSDDRLMELLAETLGAPVPPEVSTDARAVFTWRNVDAELLALGFDSATDELVGVRSAAARGRVLRFEAGDLEVELDLVEGDLEGFIVGAAGAAVTLERPGGEATELDVDAHGRFRMEAVGAGPMRLGVTDATGRHITEWFLL